MKQLAIIFLNTISSLSFGQANMKKLLISLVFIIAATGMYAQEYYLSSPDDSWRQKSPSALMPVWNFQNGMS
jgi:hypothetical protein